MFKRNGFTLVEVLLVIVIIGILAAIVIPRIAYSRKNAAAAACNANVAALGSQIELYHVQKGTWPSLQNLVDDDYIDAIPVCPWEPPEDYVINATSHRVTKHGHVP